jgi:ATP-dependent DNA helicase RecG
MSNIDIFSQSLATLRGVGPINLKFLSKLIEKDKIFYLLLHRPVKIEKIAFLPKLFEAIENQLVIVKVKVISHQKPANVKHPYKVICYNPTSYGGFVNLVFFKIFPSQIDKLKIGSEVAILGKIQKNNDEIQIVHPQEIVQTSEIEKLSKINVIYPLTHSISNKFLAQKIKEIINKIMFLKNSAKDFLEEWIDASLIKQQNWISFIDAILKIHHPQDDIDLSMINPARRRLAYDELLSWQIAILLTKNQSIEKKELTKIDDRLYDEIKKFTDSLPFDLTNSQKKVISEIAADINSEKKMLRILQGDVGSGKTVVAIISALHKIKQKKQVCIIAPTAVLAKQHYNYFTKILAGENLSIELLTSANSKKQKEKINQKLAENKINILISTHAVLEDEVIFADLGLAIIDEQHKFGVMQRLKMVNKGKDVDTLLMSATPIPRSLMMAFYADMDISVLNEKPINRQEIETLVISAKKTDQIYQSINRAIDKGEKIYWICPAIEDKEENDIDKKEENSLIKVKKKYQELINIFGIDKVLMMHGKMKDAEKEKIMKNFSDKEGSVKILVATTVVEVGVDVEYATIILIENAENFGLSQLHQLRGRVGRSSKKSYCILLYSEKFGKKQKERLDILKQSNDGFYIAEQDLRLRGSGELLGTKQSGMVEFKIADLNYDADLLKIANKQAKIVINQDQNLTKIESKKFRNLLKIFGYDECFKIIKSG